MTVIPTGILSIKTTGPSPTVTRVFGMVIVPCPVVFGGPVTDQARLVSLPFASTVGVKLEYWEAEMFPLTMNGLGMPLTQMAVVCWSPKVPTNTVVPLTVTYAFMLALQGWFDAGSVN